MHHIIKHFDLLYLEGWQLLSFSLQVQNKVWYGLVNVMVMLLEKNA